VWSCLRPDRLARAGPTRAAPLGWLRLAAVMGGTLVTHVRDIATACYQRPAHQVVRRRGGAPNVRRRDATSLCRVSARQRRADRLARAGPSGAAPLGWLRLAAVMGGTLVTHGGDIATACHQRPAHHVVRGRGGARDVRRCDSPSLCGGAAGARCPVQVGART